MNFLINRQNDINKQLRWATETETSQEMFSALFGDRLNVQKFMVIKQVMTFYGMQKFMKNEIKIKRETKARLLSGFGSYRNLMRSWSKSINMKLWKLIKINCKCRWMHQNWHHSVSHEYDVNLINVIRFILTAIPSFSAQCQFVIFPFVQVRYSPVWFADPQWQ